MPQLILHRKQLFKVSIPYWIFINGVPVGIMQGREVRIQMPEGQYNLSVRLIFRIFRWQFHIGGSRTISLTDKEQVHLQITDKERWWNILFDVDLLLWIAEFFIQLPHPWNTIYEIASNGFFALWIVHLFIIRERYFQITEG